MDSVGMYAIKGNNSQKKNYKIGIIVFRLILILQVLKNVLNFDSLFGKKSTCYPFLNEYT